MAVSLHVLLSQDNPTKLRSIERVFDQLETRSEVLEVCLTGLKWVRATDGGVGIIGAVTWMECASRVSRMADDLDAIGATAAATAFRELRSHIPLSDSEIGRGLVDWVDTEPILRKQASQLDQAVSGITRNLWAYMQENRKHLPDIPVMTSSWLVERLRSLWSGS
jgi:hypothetical protein